LDKSPDGAEVVVEATVVDVVDVVEVVVVATVVVVVDGWCGRPQAKAGVPLAAREPAVIATVATNVPPAAYQLWWPRPW
jgi:hypothetical protein